MPIILLKLQFFQCGVLLETEVLTIFAKKMSGAADVGLELRAEKKV